jgi:hypothetical protein
MNLRDEAAEKKLLEANGGEHRAVAIDAEQRIFALLPSKKDG